MVDNDDDEKSLSTRFPTGVRVAAIIWVLLGSSMFINMGVMYTAGGMQLRGYACCTPFLTILFLSFGVSVWTGLAQKTYLKGITSIFIGLISILMCFTFFGTLIMERKILKDEIVLILGSVLLILGLSSMIAGVLAIRGQDAYRLWRQHHKRTTPGDHS